MTSAVPMVWRESKDHSSDFKNTVKCPDLPSAIRPVPHSKDLPVSHPPAHARTSSSEPHILTQGELHDLVFNMNSSKKAAEILASCLQKFGISYM
ncbi:hypothetical protein PR048_014904 [Dryococelus australis]|uniref:Uncharacterized protein n=1 Tax=Dryococelus australis TaxID=614101 RepID=A0ABQ9HFF1_9NEOP|nr:hypothetical protein PR048_014904 [Dryococelus australis]